MKGIRFYKLIIIFSHSSVKAILAYINGNVIADEDK